MPMEFIQQNILTNAIAVISGEMLVWPGLRRAGSDLNTAQATQSVAARPAISAAARTSAASLPSSPRTAAGLTVSQR